jgi:hypothetical protein
LVFAKVSKWKFRAKIVFGERHSVGSANAIGIADIHCPQPVENEDTFWGEW